VSERDHGWPEGYEWPEYLKGQMMMARARRAEEILVSEIAPMEDKEEQQRALKAWLGMHCEKTQAMTRTLAELCVPGYEGVSVSRIDQRK
jgi:hypothetical protein